MKVNFCILVITFVCLAGRLMWAEEEPNFFDPLTNVELLSNIETVLIDEEYEAGFDEIDPEALMNTSTQWESDEILLNQTLNIQELH